MPRCGEEPPLRHRFRFTDYQQIFRAPRSAIDSATAIRFRALSNAPSALIVFIRVYLGLADSSRGRGTIDISPLRGSCPSPVSFAVPFDSSDGNP